MRLGLIAFFVAIAMLSMTDAVLAQIGDTVEGEITRINRAERMITVRSDSDGQSYRYMIPRGVRITVEGRSAEFRDLRRGDGIMLAFAAPVASAPPVVSRVRVPDSPVNLEQRRANPPAPVETMPTRLPATASVLPATFLFGLVALMGGLIVRRFRLGG